MRDGWRGVRDGQHVTHAVEREYHYHQTTWMEFGVEIGFILQRCFFGFTPSKRSDHARPMARMHTRDGDDGPTDHDYV
jgi:hypothetical protein